MQEQVSTIKKDDEIVTETTEAVGSEKVIDAANCCLATIDCCIAEVTAVADKLPSWHPDAAFDPAGARPVEVTDALVENWFRNYGDPGGWDARYHFRQRAVDVNNDRQTQWHEARGLTYNKLHICCGVIHRGDHSE